MKKKLSIFWVFFKIGSFTFGGGFAMLPLIERDIVDKKKWISQEEMVDILAISQSFPGAVAINSAIFIGKKVGGYSGALLALLGAVLPSFLIIILVARMFFYFKDISVVRAAFTGISSAVVALLIVVAVRIAKSSIKDKISYFIAVGALVLLILTDIHPAYIIMLGIVTGLLIYFIKSKRGKSG